MSKILDSCWIKMHDPGPYPFRDRVEWGKVLQGDRFYLLVQIRICSFPGIPYDFQVSCQSQQCGRSFGWQLDLSELPIRKLSPESASQLAQNNEFETVLLEPKKRIWFKLITGADEEKLGRGYEEAEESGLTATYAMGSRITRIEGVEGLDKKKFLETLSMQSVLALQDDMDRVDCGIDTEIQVECTRCGMVQRLELPLDRGFFLVRPEKKAQTSSQA